MKLKLIIVALAVFGWSPAVRGQGFPNKPIEQSYRRARRRCRSNISPIAEELAKNLKTQVNVVNQTAGAGAIAAEKVAAARRILRC